MDLITEVVEGATAAAGVLVALHRCPVSATPAAAEEAGILDSVDEITEEEEVVGKWNISV